MIGWLIVQCMKPKSCRICEKEFSPFTSLQKACSVKCAMEYAKRDREKVSKRGRRTAEREKRQKRKHDKDRIKTRSEWLREAQTAFNAYIRERDSGKPCISCGRYHSGQYHAGHYRTVKAAPEVRFHPFNCNLQCAPCNNHLSGNVVEYRIRLKEKIGTENLRWLEGPHNIQKYTIEDAKEIKQYYKTLMKELRND